jgi:CBS domain-containing protein
MKAREIMTAAPACCTPDDTVQRATSLMAERDCGALPVVADMERMRVVGMVTDRDVAIRGVARGSGPETLVSAVMSAEPRCCGPDDDVSTVERIMAQSKVRRVPVVNDEGSCLGMIAQADLARDEAIASDTDLRRVVESISEAGSETAPTHPT